MGHRKRTVLVAAIFFTLLAVVAIRQFSPAVDQLVTSARELDAAYDADGRGWYRPWTVLGLAAPLVFYVTFGAALQAPARFRRLALAALALVFAAWALLFIYRSSFITAAGERAFSLFDDAMISMRYAWNAAHGHGLVFNPGERVEGYTNLLTTLIMALSITVLGKNASIIAMQLFGLLTLLAAGWLTWQISSYPLPGRSRQARYLCGVLATGLLFGYYPLAYWSLMGMETGLLTALVLAAVLAVLRYGQTRNGRYLVATAVALGLAYLARPDSALVAVWILLFFLWPARARPARVQAARAALPVAAIYGCFVAGMGLFRWLYYGQLVPNTYVLKMTGMPLDLRLANGWGFVQPYLRTHGWLYLLAALALVFPDRRRQKLFLLAIPLILLAYAIWVGGDPWPYWRYMAPGAPALFVLVAAVSVRLWQALRAFLRTRAWRPAHLLARARVAVLWPVALLVALAVNGAFLPEAWLQDGPYKVEDNRLNVNRALALRHLTTPEATIGVFGAGVLPYFSERPAIDFFGKMDPAIAQLPPDLSGAVSWAGMFSVPGHNKYDLTYSIQQLRPVYIEAPLTGSQDLSAWAREHYVEVFSHGATLYLLRGSPAVYWERVAALAEP